MKLSDFQRLKRLMMLATSANDAEALQAWRRATAIVHAHGHTWESVMDKRVTILTEIEPASDLDLERDFELAMDSASGDFLSVLESIYDQWKEKGYVSDRQRVVVRDAAERAADRHRGGRVR